jgi:activator of HSP90 ATPase
MTDRSLTRRDALRLVPTFSTFALLARANAFTADDLGVSSGGDAIHQEVPFNASAARIYSTLTEAKLFRRVSDVPMSGASASVTAKPGAAFSLFNGIILGRNIECVSNERLVQAWREKDWPAGVYTLVRFQLKPQGASTLIVFDQTGIPKGDASHLAPGWWSHYWDPMKKVFAANP